MRKLLALSLLVVSLLPPGEVIAASPNPQTTTTADVIDAINATRFQNGRYPYSLNITLIGIAQSHSNYQASIGEMTHTGAKGSRSSDRAASVGYGGGATIRVNEMVYAGRTATAAAAIDFWINSEIHNPILLSEEYHEFGVGVSSDGTTTYITVNVGSVPGATSALPLVQATPFGSESTGEIPNSPEPTDTLEAIENNPDSGDVIENQPDTGDGNTSPQTPSGSSSDASQPGLLQNPIFLWVIIFVQFLAIGGLGYYVWTLRQEEDSQEKDSKTHTTLTGKKPFGALSYEQQFKQLEKLGRKALEDYDLEVVRITPLQYRLNASFQVEALPKDEPGGDLKKYMLRINSPTFQSEANIRSEMQWLIAIHRDTQLVVPDPIMTKERTLLTTVEMEGVPEPRHAVVLRWLEGKAPYENLTPDILTKVGGYMGKLHQQAINYNPPVGFERKHWDLAGFTGEMLDVPLTKARRGLSATQLATIDAAAKKIEKVTDQLGRDPEVFGLIHADLHERNYLMLDGEVRGIDFDTCGWGYFLYDLAVTLSTLITRPHFPTLKDALLNGYRQVRALPSSQESLIVPFIAARFMTNIFWLAGHKDESAFAEDAPRLIVRNIEFLEQFSQRI